MLQNRNTKAVICFVVSIFCISGLSILHAQQNYFQYYTTDDGLPGNTIPSGDTKKPIFQDRDGFIWFASFSGISIYDGNKFNNYSTTNGELSDDIVFSFQQDSLLQRLLRVMVKMCM